MIFFREINGKAKKQERVIQTCDEVISTCVLPLHQPLFFFKFSSHFFPAPFSPSDWARTVLSNKFMYSDRGNYPLLCTGPVRRKWALMCPPCSGAPNSQRKCAFADLSTPHTSRK